MYNSNYLYINNFYNYYSIEKYNFNLLDIAIIFTIISLIDFFLILLFSNKSRWFQLHASVNLIIINLVLKDSIDIYTNNFNSIRIKSDNYDNLFIIILHLYHLLTFKKITFMDVFHHFFFIGLAVIPSFLFIKSNIMKQANLIGCGIPGFIEYTTLSLVKHNKISSFSQKKIASYMYTYFRGPMCMYSATLLILFINQEICKIRENNILLIYLSFCCYLNGSFFSKLVIENFIESKYKKTV